MLFILCALFTAALGVRPENPCVKPLFPIQCFRAETIFMVDHLTGRCVQGFGCPDRGTFHTMAQCQAKCEKRKDSGKSCVKPPNSPVINCFVAETIYKYDPKTKSCLRMEGCPDVDTFKNMGQCQSTCAKGKPEPIPKNPCEQPAQPTIQCFRAETIYTYDKRSKACVQGLGCPDQGTFRTMEACEAFCVKSQPNPCIRPLRPTVMCVRAETIFVHDPRLGCVQTEGCPDQGTFKTRELCDATCTKLQTPAERSCEEICAASSCLRGTWCGEDSNGKCGCHKLDEQRCEVECATKSCPKGTKCQLAFGAACACVHDPDSTLPCNDFCSRSLCMMGTICGERNGSCGCHPPLQSNLTADENCSICQLIDCRDTPCGKLPDGTCGCLKPSPEQACQTECFGKDCLLGSSCRLQNGNCGCQKDEVPQCLDFCSRALCPANTRCGADAKGQCGCHKDEKPQCLDFCSRARCAANTRCGADAKGQCGCHPMQPVSECALNPCGPCEKCVPAQRFCIRAPCPQYDCIRSDPDNCIID